jgi:catechol 2,3-dioxygenase-like lactoylglutathione lyase family enzyme
VSARQRVSGIGGLFFRAHDPERLRRWYEEYLGVVAPPSNHVEEPWEQQAGPTVFAPFRQETEYFGRPEQGWMVNFRVEDLDAFVAQLRAEDVAVEVDPEEYPHGRFARLHDPEGNPVELWEAV